MPGAYREVGFSYCSLCPVPGTVQHPWHMLYFWGLALLQEETKRK
jgi:hypothetical protein